MLSFPTKKVLFPLKGEAAASISGPLLSLLPTYSFRYKYINLLTRLKQSTRCSKKLKNSTIRTRTKGKLPFPYCQQSLVPLSCLGTTCRFCYLTIPKKSIPMSIVIKSRFGLNAGKTLSERAILFVIEGMIARRTLMTKTNTMTRNGVVMEKWKEEERGRNEREMAGQDQKIDFRVGAVLDIIEIEVCEGCLENHVV
jgi:hypothetical protein